MTRSKKQTEASCPFWVWSNWLHIGTRAEDRRTILELSERRDDVLGRVNRGHGPLSPAEIPPLEGKLEFEKRVDDCPWPVQGMFVVSDRVRRVLETAAPGNCQFLRMKLSHNGRPSELVYWTLYVDSIDCADPEKSAWDSERRILQDPVIVAGRVPSSTSIFRVWEPVHGFSDSSIVVRDRLRRVLEREKVSGCFFYEPPEPSRPWHPSRVLTEECGQPLSEEQIADAERLLGTEIPAEYREYIREFNGRRLAPHDMPVHPSSGALVWVRNVSLFPLTSNADTAEPSVVSASRPASSARAREWLTIGVSESGCSVLLFTKGPRRGEVWVKRSGADPDDPKAGMYYAGRGFVEVLQDLCSTTVARGMSFI